MNPQSLVFLCCVSLFACTPSWTLITENNSNLTVGKLSLRAPNGWVIHGDHLNTYSATIRGKNEIYKVDSLIVTKNGIPLDQISVTRFDLIDAFPSIGQSGKDVTLPAELAEKYLAETQIRIGYDNLLIVKNEPVEIVKHNGFRLQYRSNSGDGLQYDNLVYGFITKDGFYVISFRAPSLHYFDSGLVDFNTMINSMRIVS